MTPTGPRWGRAPPKYHGQQRRATVNQPRRSATVFDRSPRSRNHPDCLSHGGSQGFKSPHLVLGKGRRERALPFGHKAGEALDRYLHQWLAGGTVGA